MEVNSIGVIGAGQMGAGVAQVAAANGYKVILSVRSEKKGDLAISKMRSSMEKRVAAGKMSPDSLDTTLKNITSTAKQEELGQCDLIVESIAEDLELKQSLFEMLSGICRKDTVFCTNTSSLSINRVMSKATHKERCVGMHFFYPVAAMKLVEIIRCDATSDLTLETVKTVAKRMNKTPVMCKTDTPGFIVNRCLFAFLLEALHCYEDGVASAQDIDTAIKLGLNHPMGPFELMDMSGIDTFPHVCGSLIDLPVTNWDCPEVIRSLIAEGKNGRKSGQGFYSY